MKYIISLMIVFVLSNCEIKVRESNAQKIGRHYYQNDFYQSGMHYRLFSYYDWEGGAAVINITKDSLEVEYYKKMLKTN
jgi:hypothetical protein